jgi:hypothetical protein
MAKIYKTQAEHSTTLETAPPDLKEVRAPTFIPVESKRLKFDIMDLMRSVRGFDKPEGYAVFPQDIVDKIEDELTRLYDIEALAAEVVNFLMEHEDFKVEVKAPGVFFHLRNRLV